MLKTNMQYPNWEKNVCGFVTYKECMVFECALTTPSVLQKQWECITGYDWHLPKFLL